MNQIPIARSILVCLALITARDCWAQPLPPGFPTVNGASADVSVNWDSGTGILTYSYSVINSTGSVGALENFAVDITTTAGEFPLSAAGLINSATGYSLAQKITEANESALGASIIPIGFISQPSGWAATITSDGGASWFWGTLTAGKISPGQSMSGFVMQSRGVPGIRRFDVSAYCESGVNSPGIDEVATDAEALQITNQENAAALACFFKGMTIGPVSPPSLTDPVKLIDFLSSQKEQAASMGWLRGDEFVRELDKKLEQAKLALVQNKLGKARKRLEQFIKLLKDQRQKQQEDAREHKRGEGERDENGDHKNAESFLNDNAFFLLKVNAEFIISQLPAKPTDESGDDRDSEGGIKPEKRDGK